MCIYIYIYIYIYIHTQHKTSRAWQKPGHRSCPPPLACPRGCPLRRLHRSPLECPRKVCVLRGCRLPEQRCLASTAAPRQASSVLQRLLNDLTLGMRRDLFGHDVSFTFLGTDFQWALQYSPSVDPPCAFHCMASRMAARARGVARTSIASRAAFPNTCHVEALPAQAARFSALGHLVYTYLSVSLSLSIHIYVYIYIYIHIYIYTHNLHMHTIHIVFKGRTTQ